MKLLVLIILLFSTLLSAQIPGVKEFYLHQPFEKVKSTLDSMNWKYNYNINTHQLKARSRLHGSSIITSEGFTFKKIYIVFRYDSIHTLTIETRDKVSKNKTLTAIDKLYGFDNRAFVSSIDVIMFVWKNYHFNFYFIYSTKSYFRVQETILIPSVKPNY